jgi:hypothetical protein
MRERGAQGPGEQDHQVMPAGQVGTLMRQDRIQLMVI